MHYPFAQQREPGAPVGQQPAREGQAGLPQEDVPEAVPQDAPSSARRATRSRLPVELNHYKEFLRGQNHYDTFLLSGVSGHGARSFYYPPQGEGELCRVPHAAQAQRRLRGEGLRRAAASARSTTTSSPARTPACFSLLKGDPRFSQHADGFQKTIDMHADFLKGTATDGSDKKVRIDLFGLKPAAASGRRLGAVCGPNCRRCSRASVPRRGRGADARPGPPVHAGHGRLERDLGRLHGGGRRRGDRPQRRDRRTRTTPARSIRGRTSSTSTCSTATATASTAATRRTSSPRSTTSRSAPARRAVVHYRLDVPADADRARRTHGDGCATASSTTST